MVDDDLSDIYTNPKQIQRCTMRLSCLQENLARGLAIVGRAVATRTTLPITQNILMETDQSRLKLSATNLELAITTWVGAKIEEEGSLTIPSRLMTDFVNSLPRETLELQSISNPIAMSFNCPGFNATINGVDSHEFPPIPSVEDGVTARMDPQILRTAINKVLIAAATEDTRPVLTGVKLEISGQQITLAAADGFRLAVYKSSLLESVSEETEAIIPHRTLAELQRMLSDQEDPVELVVTPSKSQLVVHMKDVELVSQLIQGAFPNYSQLIPQTHATKAVVNLEKFYGASRSMAAFARDGGGIVRLHISSGKVTINSNAQETGKNEGVIDANVEGEESKIAFSSKYITDVLSVLDRGEVSIETSNPSSPGVIRPVNDEDYVHVIMPMFVQW